MKNMIAHNFLHHPLFVFSLLSLWLYTTTSTSSNHQLVSSHYKCIIKERDALLDFKADLVDHSGILSTWKLETEEHGECCKWAGVACNNQTGHVTQLHLFNSIGGNGLEGTISPSLMNLSYLVHLDLRGNSFTGIIPMFIGSMTQLRFLDLSFNFFSGTIPTSIGSLTELIYLDLSDNYLLNGSCIPTELANLTNLQVLMLQYLESCTIENIDWLSRMSDLNHLVMDGISLAKADNWVNVIVRLQKLSYLSLWRCNLSQVMHPYSSSFVNSSSSSVVILYLGDNNLNSSMNHWLSPLTSNKLRELDLSRNKFNGLSFGNLCRLTSLYFSNNSVIIEFPDFLNNWSGCTSVALQGLDVSHNRFTGSLSDEIQLFSNIEYLNLAHNELSEPMSEKVWELPKLQTLDISSNYFEDDIFENIWKSKLRDINLSNNSLKGVLPGTLKSNTSYVDSIDLSACNLGPRFPKWIQNLKSLIILNLAKNRISDTIHDEFFSTRSSRFTYLNLSSNNINGEVPDLLSSFDSKKLSRIDLSSNNFSGTILDVAPSFAYLDLSKNRFHGGLSFLCQISGGYLKYVDLSHNSFSGELPDCLWHFKELQVLNLGQNSLSGRFPASIDSLIGLEVFCIYNNSFSSGEFPAVLKNFTKLTFLDLGANSFTGNLPVWVGERLSRLYVLLLAENNFIGQIPLQICQLANLQLLDLSMNNLDGTIPSCVNNLTAMVQERILSTQNRHKPLISPHHSDGVEPLYFEPKYVDHAMIHWQGNIFEISKNLRFLKGIDLSSNNLTGEIPYELTNLHDLFALNLSNNALLGNIPCKIGEMKNLLALDLSRNNISGGIPPSMSEMTLLSYLDVSYNNLMGRIPSSTQLQSFEPSRYTGNAGLCGLPLTKYCGGDEELKVPTMFDKSDDAGKKINELLKWFYIGGATGFVIVFSVVCSILLFSRHGVAFFHFLDSLQDKVHVKVAVFIAKLQ